MQPYVTLPAKKIACGFYHSASIANDGDKGNTTLYTWGRNHHRCCGLNANKDGSMEKPSPSRVEAPKYMHEVSCGINHTIFLMKKPEDQGGILYALGLGTRGRLGMYEWEANNGPKPDESAGEAIEDAWCVNARPARIFFKNFESAPQIVRVACGGDHTLCLDTEGKLYSWGMNTEGQLGLGHVNDGREPAKLDFGMDDIDVQITHFACGARHSLLCMLDGSLWTWGNNANGRLGQPNTPRVLVPTIVHSVAGTTICFVSAGEGHSGALDKNGHVWMWGTGTYGRLGLAGEIDVPMPRKIETLITVPVSQIALGGFHTLILSEKPVERIFACGMGSGLGLVQDGDNTILSSPKQILDQDVWDITNPIIQIAAGMFHSLVLQAKGTMVVWGLGTNGRLGTGKTKNEPYPYVVKGSYGFATKPLPSGIKMALLDASDQKRKKKEETHEEQDGEGARPWEVKTVACGNMHSAILTNGGSVYIWGSNEHHQLGTGTDDDLWHPRLLHVPHHHTVKELALGGNHCLVVTNNFELFSWGRGNMGQLGSGRAVDGWVPAKVMGIAAVIGCGAGEEHSAAIVKGAGSSQPNKLFCFGSCEAGKLGLGSNYTSGQQLQPMQLEKFEMPKRPKTDDEEKNAEMARQKAIQDRSPGPILARCAANHSCVVCDFGTHKQLFTFGGGWFGRLGLGDLQNQYDPQIVKLEAGDILDVQAGSFHTAAIDKPDQTLWLWGRDKVICEPEHGLTPKKFVHIDGNPKVVDVTCSEQHTLVVVEGGEVWVWGDNASRQLGLGRVTRNDEFLPVQARAFPGAVDLLATGPSHSIGLCNGDVYGWGNQSCGRLGLVEKYDAKYVLAPTKIKAEWASIEAMSGAVGSGEEEEEEAEEEEGGEAEAQQAGAGSTASQQQMENMLSAIRDGQKVQQFHTMQTLIQQEQEDAKEKTLKKGEEELVKDLTELLAEIYKLPQKEAELQALEANLQQSFGNNLKYFSHLLVPDVATLPTNQKILATFGFYEELLWVLQQQGCYLAALSMCLEDEAEKKDIFYRIVDNVYAELSDDRTLHLFLAMLKLMINKEIEHAKKPSELFHWETSRVFVVWKHFALKPLHFKDVVHSIMDSTSGGSLLAKVKLATDGGEVFALTKEEYFAGIEGDDNRDPQEKTAEFNSNLEKFKDFMTGEFTASVKACNLASNLRKVLSHAMFEIQRRQFTLDASGLNVPPELKICEPLMFLHVMGILIPMLSDPKKYAGKEVMLGKCASDSKNPALVSNITRVKEFLDRMMYEVNSDKGFSQKEHQLLISIAKNIKPVLLRYIKEQGTKDITDDTDTKLTIDLYVSHFDRRKHVVTVQTSDLLKLSNMLKEYENKLRLTDKDKVEELCNKIGQWDAKMMEEASKNEQLHNFVMNSRFLFKFKSMVICKTSHCPVPPVLSAVGASTSEEVEVVTRYIPEDPHDPRRVLEELFRDLPEINVTNFQEMAEEFDRLMKKYSTGSPPDFDMTNRLSVGLEKLQELQTVEAHAEDVLQFMSDGLTARDKHRQYLQEVFKGKEVIAIAQKHYQDQMKSAAGELKAALRFSMDLQLPEKYTSHGSVLKFMEVNAKIVKLRSFDPATMPAGCSYAPSAAYMFSKLKKDKIFISCDSVAPEMHKKLQFTFRTTNSGELDVIVNIVQGKALNQVSRFKITADEVQAMKKMEKGAQTTIGAGHGPGGGDFAVVVGNKLVDLILALQK